MYGGAAAGWGRHEVDQSLGEPPLRGLRAMQPLSLPSLNDSRTQERRPDLRQPPYCNFGHSSEAVRRGRGRRLRVLDIMQPLLIAIA